MATITDPARELADICDALRHRHQDMGADVLAGTFGVPVWSTSFYQIIFTISGRIDGLKDLVVDLDMDDDVKEHARQHLTEMMQAFTPGGLNNAWDHALKNFISSANVSAVRMLSPTVRQVHSYPKLDDVEIAELISELTELLLWLDSHQINEQDFIRQAIVDGLSQLVFRLERVKWLGWGYTVESLREVIGAYLALERGITANQNPDAEAVLKKTLSFVSTFFEKVKFAQETVGGADFILRAYGAVTLITQGKAPIAGLLGSLAGS